MIEGRRGDDQWATKYSRPMSPANVQSTRAQHGIHDSPDVPHETLQLNRETPGYAYGGDAEARGDTSRFANYSLRVRKQSCREKSHNVNHV